MDTKRLFNTRLLLLTMISIPIIFHIMPLNDVKDLVNLNPYLNSNITTSNLIKIPQDVEISYPPKSRRLPQAIIIGVNKGGTGALITMMKMHSKIVAPNPEIHFFDDKYDRGMEWYQQQMPYSYADQITMEKTPSYFRTKNIPLRIHSMNSSIRLILIVRDPVIRSISNYVHNQAIGKRAPTSIEEAVLLSDGTVNPDEREIANSLYELPFKLYLEVFPREQILVVDGDQLIIDPLPIIQKVERFLNLEPEITKESFYFSKKKGFYCMKSIGKESCLNEQKGREHPKVDEDVLRKLRVFFAPYNQRFYDLVGHDFGWATS